MPYSGTSQQSESCALPPYVMGCNSHWQGSNRNSRHALTQPIFYDVQVAVLLLDPTFPHSIVCL
jgi:hypothetical protein